MLVEKISSGILKLNPSNGKGEFRVKRINGKVVLCPQNETDCMVMPSYFCLIGDMKYLMMMLGRDGYSSSQCLYCLLIGSEWKKLHKNGKILCGGELWTMEKLIAPFVDTQASSSEPSTIGTKTKWQKESPLWSFIPITHVILPLLHIILGFGN